MSRLDEIRARLADADDWGHTRWHDTGCTYVISDAQFPCDCMRLDVEHLVALIADQDATIGELMDELGQRPRCGSIHVEDRGRRRSWRCDRVEGHEGPHTSTSGHRRWT